MATETASSKPWVDEPLALISTPMFTTKQDDVWISGASHMCHVHNVIFRGYNSIYLQAPHVREPDKGAFLGYCLTWCKLVMTHAAEEESAFFPEAERLLEDSVFEETHKEHGKMHTPKKSSLFSQNSLKPSDAFMPQLQAFHDYLATLEDPSQLSAEKMLSLMSAFQQPFELHFRNEIELIASLTHHARSPKKGSPEEQKARAKFDKWGSSSVTKNGITDVLMFFFHNLDRDFEEGFWNDWPEIPQPIRWLLPRVLGTVHNDWWKFASCDANGRRTELYLP